MKRYTYIVLATLAIFAVGCNQDVVPTDDSELADNSTEISVPEPEEELVSYSFTIANPDLKSSLTNAGVFSWAVDDEIAIYNSTTSSYVNFTVTAVDGSGNATISAAAASGAVWTNAIYPAARAAGSGNAVDYTVTTVSGPILVSQVDGQNLYFKYLGAVANIRVDGVPGSPASLTFTANANVFGSRTFSWSEGEPVLGDSGTQASITVPFVNNTIISIPIPQVSYAGFSITVDNASGRHLYKKTTANTFDMSSKKLLPMPTLTFEHPMYFLKTVANDGKPNYWSQADMPLIRTGANTFSITVNADRMSTYYIYDEWNSDAPTTRYIASGSVTNDTYTANTFTIIGAVNSWKLEDNSDYVMNKIGDWNYIIGASGLHNTEFKFNPWNNTSDWTKPVGFDGESAAWFNGENHELSMVANRANTGLDYSSGKVDIYLNTETGKGQWWPNGTKGNPLCSHVRFELNGSTGDVALNINGQAPSTPFSNSDYPTESMALSGTFNSWSHTANTFTYNGNMSWVSEGLVIASAGDYTFKIRKAEDSWTFVAGGNSGLGSALYGSLRGDADNATITLGAGTYNVYMNATTDWYYNIMFVKQ